MHRQRRFQFSNTKTGDALREIIGSIEREGFICQPRADIWGRGCLGYNAAALINLGSLLSMVILSIGLIVFVAYFFRALFERTGIPDVLFLLGAGILVGPVLGMTSPADFGKAGPVLSTMALIVILLESGTDLDLQALRGALRPTLTLSLLSFGTTSLVIAYVGWAMLGLSLLPAAMLGVICGCTAASVVIPLVQMVDMGEKARTILILESAIADVLSIVGILALLDFATSGGISAGRVAGSTVASMLMATVIGILGGLGWLLVLKIVRRITSSMFATVAYCLLIYGIAEQLGFSGALAALSFGLALSNHRAFGLDRLAHVGEIGKLKAAELNFFAEIVFVLKTFFFVYLGISMQFTAPRMVWLAVLMVVTVCLARHLVVMLTMDRDISRRDAAVSAIMMPKGLVSAVLATIPLQQGVVGGEIIRDATYMIVLVSIVLTAALLPLYDRPPLAYFYGRAMARFAGTGGEEPRNRGP